MPEIQYGLTFGNIEYTIETYRDVASSIRGNRHFSVACIDYSENLPKKEFIKLIEKLNNEGLDGVLLPYSKKESSKLLKGLDFTLLPNKETSLLDFSGKVYDNKNLFKEKY